VVFGSDAQKPLTKNVRHPSQPHDECSASILAQKPTTVSGFRVWHPSLRKNCSRQMFGVHPTHSCTKTTHDECSASWPSFSTSMHYGTFSEDTDNLFDTVLFPNVPSNMHSQLHQPFFFCLSAILCLSTALQSRRFYHSWTRNFVAFRLFLFRAV
jgi:hypothetical protein